jgi:hypothetical protein
VTKRVQQAHSALGAADLWQAVSQNAKDRAAWRYHQHRRRIVNEFDVFALGDLSVTSMVQKVQKVQHGPLAKSIHGAAGSQFAALIV